MYYKIIKPLCLEFSLVMIDLIGMGGSSRPLDYNYIDMTAEQSIDYFVEYLERWRVAMGNLTDFYLSGHSLGAYIAGNYAEKYQQYIKKLILISPPGVCARIQPGEEKNWQSLIQSTVEIPRRVEWIIQYLFKIRFSAFAYYRFIGLRRSYDLLQKMAKSTYTYCSPQARVDIGRFLYQTFLRRATTETCIQVMFNVSMKGLLEPKVPLGSIHKLASPNFTLPFCIIFGDVDWMLPIDNGAS